MSTFLSSGLGIQVEDAVFRMPEDQLSTIVISRAEKEVKFEPSRRDSSYAQVAFLSRLFYQFILISFS